MVTIMETRDLFDKNGNLTGKTIIKDEPIPEGQYIAVTLCFIQNNEGDFLIQKRSIQKNGKYGFPSGHLETGESSLQGMIRELNEEMGIDVQPMELELMDFGRNDEAQYFYSIYYLRKEYNLKDLILQQDEVDFVEWDSLEQIQELVDNNLFSPSHLEIFLKLKDILKEK